MALIAPSRQTTWRLCCLPSCCARKTCYVGWSMCPRRCTSLVSCRVRTVSSSLSDGSITYFTGDTDGQSGPTGLCGARDCMILTCKHGVRTCTAAGSDLMVGISIVIIMVIAAWSGPKWSVCVRESAAWLKRKRKTSLTGCKRIFRSIRSPGAIDCKRFSRLTAFPHIPIRSCYLSSTTEG